MPRVIAIIPARLGSTRLPGKVLLDQTGKPLIQHVYESARAARSLERVVIATDEQRVLDACARFGAPAVMTRADHPNGTSRLSEAAAALGLADDDIIVNVQGDEPEVEAGAIDAAVAALEPDASMATLAVPFAPGEDPRDPNCVKVVLDARSRAMYFSRSLIPFDRDGVWARAGAGGVSGGAGVARPLRHVGLYVYRRAFLDRYIALPPTSLEQIEQLEQLRALQHGYAIAVALAERARVGIDTPEQYAAFVARVKAAGGPGGAAS